MSSSSIPYWWTKFLSWSLKSWVFKLNRAVNVMRVAADIIKAIKKSSLKSPPYTIIHTKGTYCQ